MTDRTLLEDSRAMLSLDLEKVCFVMLKAREFDAKVMVEEPDHGSNAADDDMSEVLQDYPDDATADELKAAIDRLNVDEQIELVALTWLGRGDYGVSEWGEARSEATWAHNDHTSDYLMGIPLLSDYIEEGLAAFELSCMDMEMGRL